MSEVTVAEPASPGTAAPSQEQTHSISLGMRLSLLSIIIFPFLGVLAGIVLLWGHGFGWVELGLLSSMYLLTGFGITVGFHRLFTHRSFRTNWVVQSILAILGSMAVQGPVLHWVAMHRRHHQFSDRDGDPHSPLHHGNSILGLLRGMWHAHVGWVFRPLPADMSRYVSDLRRSPLVRSLNALFPVWVLSGLVIPSVLGGLFMWSWWGVLLGFVWGGLVRIFLVHHVTWSINSVCHVWGRQPYRSNDGSRNNFLFGVLGLGEGWHNNHHAFPTSARHGLRWWQIDFSYLLIRGLALVGLAWEVRQPDKNSMPG